MSTDKKPRYVALDGDVLMFRVLDGDMLVDRVYVRDTSIREDFNCWKQFRSAKAYAMEHDPEMYAKHWGSSIEERAA